MTKKSIKKMWKDENSNISYENFLEDIVIELNDNNKGLTKILTKAIKHIDELYDVIEEMSNE